MFSSLLRRAWAVPSSRLTVPCHSLPSPSTLCCRLSSTAAATAPAPFAPQEIPPNPDDFASIKNAISNETYRAITVRPYKFQTMSEVQKKVLGLLPNLALPYPEAKAPRDVMVRARTGTGKTLSFLVPAIEARMKVLEKVGKKALQENNLVNDTDLESRAQRVFARENVGTLILTPTRELAVQIAKEAANLSSNHRDFTTHTWIGAMSKRTQMRDFMSLRRDIIVATPGRLRDLMESEPEVKRSLATTRQLIFDEADTMLEIGFRDDIEAIVKDLPPTPERQTFLFSATLQPKVKEVARKHLAADHTYIDCIKEEDSPVHASIPQYHTVLPSASEQIPHVLRLIAHDQLTNPGASKIIVFLPTTKMTQLFSTILQTFGRSILPTGKTTKVLEIHSKRPQVTRSRVSEQFKSDKSGASVLVTSDVSARGVDYPGVTRVIQVGIPASREQYIHRVGRTGRGAMAGQGRGDFVLLPWEVGFVSWQLTDIPIKPLTVAETKTQLSELAKKHDADPPAMPKPNFSGKRFQRETVAEFQVPYTPLLDEYDRLVSEFGPRLDVEAVTMTMTSLLGYYMAKSADLRVSQSVILEGIKSWSTDAVGLDQVPYIPQSLLSKLGVSDNRTRSYGTGRAGQYAKPRREGQYERSSRDGSYDRTTRDRKQAPWMGRGSQRVKDSRPRQEWSYKEHQSGGFDEGRPKRFSYGDSDYGGSRSRPMDASRPRRPFRDWNREEE
ncbi:hypothetical protein V5O48_000697 [Marasmius crinis-equi]|uniref:ATP-dependent RNA helicase n=1 Tax=Marasmius crinis-equi TaxID=585013 RepID=A0ABR3G0Z3_9AGAR